jgi:hypothetical protein
MSSDIVKRLRFKRTLSSSPYEREELKEAADRIEALEGEVDTLKICIDAHVVASELGESMNEQLYREVQSANARAERLRVALEQIGEGTRDGQHCALIANTALEDDKPAIRAAAGGGE